MPYLYLLIDHAPLSRYEILFPEYLDLDENTNHRLQSDNSLTYLLILCQLELKLHIELQLHDLYLELKYLYLSPCF